MNTLSVIVLLPFLLFGKAQVFYNGKCRQLFIMNDFNITRYLGKWYEIAKYPNVFQLGDCTETNVIHAGDGSQMIVINKDYHDRQVQGTIGYLQILEHGSGHLQVTLKRPFFGYGTTDYDILSTDYENWAVVHSCWHIRNIRFENAWVLSRKKYLTDEQIVAIDEIIDKNHLDRNAFQHTNHIDCPDFEHLPFVYYA